MDATKIELFVTSVHTLWDGIFQIAGYMTILGFLLGWTCLVGLMLILFCIPIMGIITGKMFGLNRSMVEYTDERVKTSNEALQGILCVKMYSWEGPLSKQIDRFRQEEIKSLRKIAYLRAFSRSYMSALPTFAAASTFLVYVYATDRSVSASILFSSIVAFDMLRFPLMFYVSYRSVVPISFINVADFAQFFTTAFGPSSVRASQGEPEQKLGFIIYFVFGAALILHSSLFAWFDC